MSIKCGNPKHGGIDIRHETVADVRACFASPNGVADFAPTTEGVRFPVSAEFAAESLAPQNHFQAAIASEWGAPTAPAETLAEINEDQQTWPWSYRNGKDQHPFDLGRRVAEACAEAGIDRRADLENGPGWTGPVFMAPEPEARPARDPMGDSATDKQMAFLRILVAERSFQGLSKTHAEIAGAVADSEAYVCDFGMARELISALKLQPRKALAANAHKKQPWRELSEKVPAGNYAITDDEGKNHFYRVSVGRNGFYKLQERASEELHFISLNRYEGILSAILKAGVEEARLAYARLLGRCWHCHTALTDNTQPHFVRGLGPICGDKN